MHEHIAEAVKEPDVVTVPPGAICLRFETMKLYSALGAVRHLLETGQVKPGDTLVDSSSGIYAHALALACHRYGLNCHIVGSTTVDRTLRVQLEILGATLEQVRPSKNLRLDQNLRVERIGELLRENPHYHWMRQYHDAIHYLGYRDVADLIRKEVPEGPLSLVGGVGTGASTGAIATYLREAGRDVTLVGVQPFGSVTFGAGHVSDPDMIIAGIGSSIPFQNVRHGLYDRIHWVNFDYAMSGAVELLRASGIFAGLSAGAAYLATLWEREREADRTYVFMAADTGHRYVDSAYANHPSAKGLGAMRPHEVTAQDELRHPWSAMDWPPADSALLRGGSVPVPERA
ncbi:pyridoxal-phosphate dependent enzyme [Streptomyces griseomycini]|uniref:Cysteine synthase A n=1 Tax=Streptomyces griseomycini TaxID=66895 RepID=A0A7W7V9X8_9ACTN|nr:pyridoxal-phosphate dependent enzyme [Streptomyces griseomycini]MBB4902401.1 cysteine synthase A [Streptomyces griseomycini]GGQ26899.1 cysteine synthase [Streptomyces griseomycini]GGR45939.1 cysteine synthase [Streptomyces griseomycini]